MLVPRNRMHIKNKFFSFAAKYSDELLAFLHANYRAVFEDNFDCMVCKGCKSSKTTHCHLLNYLIATTHVLNIEFEMIDRLFKRLLLVS